MHIGRMHILLGRLVKVVEKLFTQVALVDHNDNVVVYLVQEQKV